MTCCWSNWCGPTRSGRAGFWTASPTPRPVLWPTPVADARAGTTNQVGTAKRTTDVEPSGTKLARKRKSAS
jgi:hypothetical protein